MERMSYGQYLWLDECVKQEEEGSLSYLGKRGTFIRFDRRSISSYDRGRRCTGWQETEVNGFK